MRTLTLFAGAGGADVGLRAAGFDHLLGVEWDADAAEAARRAGFPVVTGDVRDLSLYADLVGQVDLLWASPPCQDWSTAGAREGAEGERNGWPWTLDVADLVAPRWLLAENVRGMLQHSGKAHKGDDDDDAPEVDGDGFLDDPKAIAKCPACWFRKVLIPQVRERFAWVDFRLIDCADHGVPQRRHRVILAAGPVPLPWPEATHSGEALTKAKWGVGDYWRNLEIEPVGEPSAAEARWLRDRRQLGLFYREPPRFALRPWRTVRQALDLVGVLEASRNTDANPNQERPRDTDEPAQTIGVKGNLYLNSPNTRSNERGAPAQSVDLPAYTVSSRGDQMTLGDKSTASLGTGVRVAASSVVFGLCPPPTTFVELVERNQTERLARAGSEPWRQDQPSPTVTAQEVEGTRASPSSAGGFNGGPDRASDAVWLATGRRRLEVEECAILQDFPPDYPFHGTKSERYRQVGNAVPPTLARVLGEAIKRAEAGSA